MNDSLLAAVLLLVCVVAIVAGVVRRSRGPRPGDGGVAALGRYRAPSRTGGLVAGLVAACATASGVSALGPAAPVAAATGAAVGILVAVVVGLRMPRLLGGVVGALGIVGIAGAASALLAPSCSPVPAWARVLALVVIAIAAAAGIVLRLLTGSFRPQSVLAVFGSARVVTFLASPFGVSLIELPVPTWVLCVGAAAVFGILAGLAPDFVIGVTALAISLASIAVAATLGTPCSTGAGMDDGLALVGFLVGYGAVRGVAGLLGR
jgi:hypothetical protein